MKITVGRLVRVGGGVLSHESLEIKEVFHDSPKSFKGLHVSHRISAGWNDYSAIGTICNDLRSF